MNTKKYASGLRFLASMYKYPEPGSMMLKVIAESMCLYICFSPYSSYSIGWRLEFQVATRSDDQIELTATIIVGLLAPCIEVPTQLMLSIV